MELVVHKSAQALAAATADRIAALIQGPHFSMGLAGGSTPASTYRALGGHDVEWPCVDAWLSDERWIPHHHDRSNGRMAAESLLDHVEARFHRPPWEESLTPSDAASAYEDQIRSIHPERGPDLVLLGMGEDGHTASLFPGTAALDEGDRWIVANRVPQHGETRITATFPLLWAASHVLFLVVGASKAKALRDSLAGMTPAGRVNEGKGEVEWHVDMAAASLLS